MASNDMRSFLGTRPTGQVGQTLVSGVVSANQPAPASFSDPLWVLVPSIDAATAISFAVWPRLHGTSLPQPGALVLVAIDEKGGKSVVRWDGPDTDPVNGHAVGGALSGTLPNPSLAAGAAAGNVGTLGGVLGGTLPNPSMASGAAATNVGTLGGDLSGTLPNPTVKARLTPLPCSGSASLTAWQLAVYSNVVVPTFTLPTTHAVGDQVGVANYSTNPVAYANVTAGTEKIYRWGLVGSGQHTTVVTIGQTLILMWDGYEWQTIMDTQSPPTYTLHWVFQGTDNVWSGNITTPTTLTDSNSNNMSLTYTTPHTAWADVTANVVLQCTDTSMIYTNVYLVCNPTDANGIFEQIQPTPGNNASGTFMTSASVRRLFALAAGTTYTFSVQLSPQVGSTWKYLKDYNSQSLDALIWPRGAW